MIAKIVITCKLDFECHYCHTSEQGTQQISESLVYSTHEAVDTLNATLTQLRSHDMPIGWASFSDGKGGTIFRCSNCKQLPTAISNREGDKQKAVASFKLAPLARS